MDTNKPRQMEKENLGKGLKSRHIQMIAIGGAIGSSLFYGAAGAIQTTGPSIILSYSSKSSRLW